MTGASSSPTAPLEALFRALEAPRGPHVFAVFRVAFFVGLGLHFGPALVFLDETYGVGVVRGRHWNESLYALLPHIPFWLLRALSSVTMLAMASACAGFRPRASATVSFVGLYAFASFNALPVQTLALANAWAVLPLFCVCRGASAAWSVDAWLRRRARQESLPPPTLLANLVLFQLLLAFFFAGVEKVLWGWPMNNEMAMLFKTPRGYILRDWAQQLSLMRNDGVTMALSWFTVVVELLAPPAMLFARTRLLGFALYELLFLGIIAMIEVPPLFFAMFAVGIVLILRREDLAPLERVARSLRRAF